MDIGNSLCPHIQHQGVHQRDVVLVTRLCRDLHIIERDT